MEIPSESAQSTTEQERHPSSNGGGPALKEPVGDITTDGTRRDGDQVGGQPESSSAALAQQDKPGLLNGLFEFGKLIDYKKASNWIPSLGWTPAPPVNNSKDLQIPRETCRPSTPFVVDDGGEQSAGKTTPFNYRGGAQDGGEGSPQEASTPDSHSREISEQETSPTQAADDPALGGHGRAEEPASVREDGRQTHTGSTSQHECRGQGSPNPTSNTSDFPLVNETPQIGALVSEHTAPSNHSGGTFRWVDGIEELPPTNSTNPGDQNEPHAGPASNTPASGSPTIAAGGGLTHDAENTSSTLQSFGPPGCTQGDKMESGATQRPSNLETKKTTVQSNPSGPEAPPTAPANNLAVGEPVKSEKRLQKGAEHRKNQPENNTLEDTGKMPSHRQVGVGEESSRDRQASRSYQPETTTRPVPRGSTNSSVESPTPSAPLPNTLPSNPIGVIESDKQPSAQAGDMGPTLHGPPGDTQVVRGNVASTRSSPAGAKETAKASSTSSEAPTSLRSSEAIPPPTPPNDDRIEVVPKGAVRQKVRKLTTEGDGPVSLKSKTASNDEVVENATHLDQKGPEGSVPHGGRDQRTAPHPKAVAFPSSVSGVPSSKDLAGHTTPPNSTKSTRRVLDQVVLNAPSGSANSPSNTASPLGLTSHPYGASGEATGSLPSDVGAVTWGGGGGLENNSGGSAKAPKHAGPAKRPADADVTIGRPAPPGFSPDFPSNRHSGPTSAGSFSHAGDKSRNMYVPGSESLAGTLAGKVVGTGPVVETTAPAPSTRPQVGTPPPDAPRSAERGSPKHSRRGGRVEGDGDERPTLESASKAKTPIESNLLTGSERPLHAGVVPHASSTHRGSATFTPASNSKEKPPMDMDIQADGTLDGAGKPEPPTHQIVSSPKPTSHTSRHAMQEPKPKATSQRESWGRTATSPGSTSSKAAQSQPLTNCRPLPDAPKGATEGTIGTATGQRNSTSTHVDSPSAPTTVFTGHNSGKDAGPAPLDSRGAIQSDSPPIGPPASVGRSPTLLAAYSKKNHENRPSSTPSDVFKAKWREAAAKVESGLHDVGSEGYKAPQFSIILGVADADPKDILTAQGGMEPDGVLRFLSRNRIFGPACEPVRHALVLSSLNPLLEDDQIKPVLERLELLHHKLSEIQSQLEDPTRTPHLAPYFTQVPDLSPRKIGILDIAVVRESGIEHEVQLLYSRLTITADVFPGSQKATKRPFASKASTQRNDVDIFAEVVQRRFSRRSQSTSMVGVGYAAPLCEDNDPLSNTGKSQKSDRLRSLFKLGKLGRNGAPITSRQAAL